MKKKFLPIALAAALVVALLLTGCASRQSTDESTGNEAGTATLAAGIDLTSEGLKIGFSAGNMTPMQSSGKKASSRVWPPTATFRSQPSMQAAPVKRRCSSLKR